MAMGLLGGLVAGDAVEAEAAGGVAELVVGAYVPVSVRGAADFPRLDNAAPSAAWASALVMVRGLMRVRRTVASLVGMFPP